MAITRYRCNLVTKRLRKTDRKTDPHAMLITTAKVLGRSNAEVPKSMSGRGTTLKDRLVAIVAIVCSCEA